MKEKGFLKDVWFIIISSSGGLLLSLAGLSIGWMIGTLIMAAFLSFQGPAWLKLSTDGKGIPQYWLRIGQCILAIELGRKINLSVLHIFQENWMTILIILLLSIIFSVFSGFILWKSGGTDMLTSFFGTAPGGLSAMPGIAEEVGANTAVVTIIQTMRVFLVVFTVPIIISSWIAHPADHTSIYTPAGTAHFEISQVFWTVVLGLAVWGGYYVGKFLRLPAPWLVGGMLSVAIVQTLISSHIGYDLMIWWPHSVIVLSQVFIAASIGSRFHKHMLIGLRKTMVVALLSTFGLISIMFACAFLVSKMTGISFVTASLAFAPGGIAEMATMAVVLHADSTFVVAVQVLRILVVCILLPPFFRLLNHWKKKKDTYSHVSA